MSEQKPQVAIIMGSNSDWPIMQNAASTLEDFNISFEAKVISAHRTPDMMFELAENAQKNGFKVIIAGAGGSAHLPGMVASLTPLPVVGVPIPLSHLDGLDSLLSMAQMPAGVPVATVAVGNARNAGLLAVRMLAVGDADLRGAMVAFQEALRESALHKGALVRGE